MAKRLINIGDKFGSWTVIGLEENDKKYNYNYICKCDCGNLTMIRKDKLVDSSFPACKKCPSNFTINKKWDLIQKQWDTLTNGKLVLSELDTNKFYFWKCEHGHRYKAVIGSISEKCPICIATKVEREIISTKIRNFTNVVSYFEKVCEELGLKTTLTVDPEILTVHAVVNDFIIYMSPAVHTAFNIAVHETKSVYYEISSKIKSAKKEIIKDSREHIFISLDLVLKRDIDKIKNILAIVKDR